MFCKPIFAPLFLLFFLVLTSELKAMIEDKFDESKSNHIIRKQEPFYKNEGPALKIFNFPFHCVGLSEEVIREISNNLLLDIYLPKEISIEIFRDLGAREFLIFRQTSKKLKATVDKDYWKAHPINIRAKSSSLAIQDIKDISCSAVSLSFEKWEQKDMEQLLFFKHVTSLRLTGLNSWDFSTGRLFNPDPFSSGISYVFSIVNTTFLNTLGVELAPPTIFANVISLDLSHSSIGDYGVISFVSHFKKLENLNISNNDIGRNIMDESNAIANLNTLTSLNISKNHFSSETVKEIAQLTNLTSLDISYNFINDNIVIRKLGSLPKLINFMRNNQSQKRNSNNFSLPFLHHPLQWRGGRLSIGWFESWPY